MSKTIEALTGERDALQAEVERLRAHSNDLLAERKAEKERREKAEADLAALQEAHDAAVARLEAITIDEPILRALEGVTVAPPDQGRKLLEEAGIRFAVGNEGVAVAIDGETQIALPDLKGYLSRACDKPEGLERFGWFIPASASGSGAPGGSMGGSTPRKETKSTKGAPILGLR